jgi:hypothetical protein
VKAIFWGGHHSGEVYELQDDVREYHFPIIEMDFKAHHLSEFKPMREEVYKKSNKNDRGMVVFLLKESQP